MIAAKLILRSFCSSMRLLLLSSLLLAAACSGDLTPLEEAVFASEIELAEINIDAPSVSTVDGDIVLNVGEQLQFTFTAEDINGNGLSLAPASRRWSSSNPAAGSVSELGLFTATAEQTTEVSLRIGGIAASEPVTIVVRNAEMTGVEIPSGPLQVSQCSASDYIAMGVFDDGTVRTLQNVTWSLVTPPSDPTMAPIGVILQSDGSSASVALRESGAYTLTSTQDGFSASANIVVDADLMSLEVLPFPAAGILAEGESFELLATATYTDGSVEDVSGVVDWRLDAAETIATVLLPSEAGGRVSLLGLREGFGQVVATCGTFQAMGAITVTEQEFTLLRLLDENDDRITDTSITLNVGDTLELTATAIAEGGDGSEVDVTEIALFLIDDIDGDEDDIVTIELGSEVVLTAEAAGTVVLDVSVNGAQLSLTIEVTGT